MNTLTHKTAPALLCQLGRIIAALVTIFCLPSVQAQVVTTGFNHIVWLENFDSAGAHWRNANSTNESMLFSRGRYYIERKLTGAGLHVLPQRLAAIADFEAELKLELGTKEGSTAGLIVMAQENGKGAFVAEINQNGSYRLLQFNGSQYQPIGKEGLKMGWKKHKALEKRGLNTLMIRCFGRKYDFYINGIFAESFFEPRWVKGVIGIFVGPGSQAQIDRMVLRAPAPYNLSDSLPSKERVLTDIIISLRQTINAQKEELDSIKVVIKSLQGSSAGNKQNLAEENKRLQAEVKKQELEIKDLKRRLIDLEKFKNAVEKSGDADVIIKLTQLLDEEQKEKNRLQIENERLLEEIARLKQLLE